LFYRGEYGMGTNIDMMPTRAKIPARQVEVVGRTMAERIISQWGMVNGKKIVAEMKKWFKDEVDRRKKIKRGR
jgi:hypothetical protein